jgi:diguanylate cyclase (GGDEF)-like protein
VVPKEGWEQVYEAINTVRRVEKVRARKDDRTYEISGFFTGESVPEAGRSQLILLRDITEDLRLSTLDPLTNVFNRRFINQILIKEIARSQRYSKEFSLVICDMDGFKNINDTYGHMIGDQVLKFFSQLLTKDLRKVDIVGRYGGDEFVLVLPETTRTSAIGVVTRLQERLQNEELLLPDGRSIRVASSFGIATYPMNGPSGDDLLVAADQELYTNKSKRRSSGPAPGH